MNVKFKWSPGDVVWFMYNDEPTQGKIRKCWYNSSINCVDFTNTSTSEKYYVYVEHIELFDCSDSDSDPDGDQIVEIDIHEPFTSEELFYSKEDLVRSL